MLLSVVSQTVWGQEPLVNTEEITEVIVAFGSSTEVEIEAFENTKDKNGDKIFTKKDEITALNMVLYQLPASFPLDIPTLDSLDLPMELQTVGSSEEKREYTRGLCKGKTQANGVDLNFFLDSPVNGSNDSGNNSNNSCVLPFNPPCNGVSMPEDLSNAVNSAQFCNSIKVAVLGTGIDFTHPLFSTFLTSTYTVLNEEVTTDENGHETHVSGIIAHTLDLAGLASNTELISIKTQDQLGVGTLFAMLKGIALASNAQAEVVNISSGYYDNQEPSEEFTPLLELAFAYNPNILFVTSTGNDTNNNDGIYRHYPSNINYLDNVISVAALCHSDELAGYSNYGNETVDLAAYGTGICSASVQDITGELWTIKSGTSMAAPYVSATAALIVASGQNLTAAAIKDAILDNADYEYNLEDYTLTDGRLNAELALQSVSTCAFGGPSIMFNKTNPFANDVVEQTVKVYPQPIHSNEKLTIDFSLATNERVQIAIFSSTGQLQLLKENEYTVGNHQFIWSEMNDVESFQTGTYILRITLGGEVFHRKILRI